MKLSLNPSKEALAHLELALSIKKPSDLERDGTIQRFEYCYELMWKLAQRTLKNYEVEAESPKATFREMGRLGWVSSVEAWLEFQKSRNETSHEYGEKLAKKSYELAKVFLPLAKELFSILQKKINED